MPKWTMIAGGQPCGSDSCPAIFMAEEGHLYVQGRRVSDDVRAVLALRVGEEAVEIPKDLLEEALESLRPAGDEH